MSIPVIIIRVDVKKDSFYEELEQAFDQFPRYHMKILLGDFNAKVGRDIYPDDDDRDGHRNVGILRTPNAADSPRRLYQTNSRLVPFLKFIYVSVQISNIFVFIISFKLINFAFQIFPFLVLKCSNGFTS
jgi:hypothetical protein